MLEQLKPSSQQPSHARSLREDAVRRLSRSPHPYHRQQFEIQHGSARFSKSSLHTQSPLRSRHNTDDEEPEERGSKPHSYRESTNSDSGTEADDEHVLKGLPAPKLRPHKGLRGGDGSLSGTPSPILSPAVLDEDIINSPVFMRRTTIPSVPLSKQEAQRATDKYLKRRHVEVVRRATEVGLLVFVGGVICLHSGVRHLLWVWRGELMCEFLVAFSLIAAYPLRVLRHSKSLWPLEKPIPLAVPSAFDPAPLIYPPIITLLVSSLLCADNTVNFLPSIILGIASLPRDLIPSTGGLQGSNLCHWLLSIIPLEFSRFTGKLAGSSYERNHRLHPEYIVLIPALHQALCVTLHYLTTTSLLSAELQLLSVALIDLLFLAASPQAVILKALLWGGGIGVLVTSAYVLRWGVALARIPKWRFRRAEHVGKPLFGRGGKFTQKPSFFGNIGASVLGQDGEDSDSGDEVKIIENTTNQRKSPILTLKIHGTMPTNKALGENGSISAVEPKANGLSINGSAKHDAEPSLNIHRRHTLPALTQLPPKSAKRTPSGRRKRAFSAGAQSFFALTQAQATLRKWLYAGYVYICIIFIILAGIRTYVQEFALQGNEPIGWALGYLFGDLPRFRMEVVMANLQRWICLPSRSDYENDKSCHLGWVEHLRHSSFGEANTRLILCGYWLAIIITGLAVVFRLSAVYEVDTRRKVFHFMMVAMLLPATFVDPTFAALALSLMLAIFLLLDLFRASQLPPLSKSLAYFLTPYVDGRDLKGPVVISHIFLLIGCAIPLWLSLGALPRTGKDHLVGWEVPTREVSMVSGVICVGMGDAAASLIGRRYGRRKWLWGGGKSIEGSIAFATAVGLALILAKAWLRIGGWVANNSDPWIMTIGKSGVAAWVASLTEAVLTGGNDNVVVPVVLWLCVKGLDI